MSERSTRSRVLSVGLAVCVALVLIATTALAAQGALLPTAPKTPCGGKITKCQKAELTPHSVVSSPSGTTTASFTLTILNESNGSTQFVDSCDYAPASPLVVASVDPTVAVYDSSNVAQPSGTSNLSGGVDQLRAMKIPYKGKAVAQLSMTIPAGNGSAGGSIICKLSNGFNNNDPGDPQSNAVGNDPATNLNVSWSVPVAPAFSIAFTDADAGTAGVQRDLPDPVTSAGIVRYVARISNTGNGAGSTTFTDSATNGAVIKLLDGCASQSGINTASASCTVGPIAAGGFADVRIDVQAQSVTGNSSTVNTASIPAGSDNETTAVVPAVQKCGTFDCVTTYYEPRLGLTASTGAANANNPFAIKITIPADPSAPIGGQVLQFKELFDNNGCGNEQPCTLGNQQVGNMFEFFTLPAACGTKKCTVTNSYETQILFQISPQVCQSTCVGYWETDPDVAGNNHRLRNCGLTNTDPKCTAGIVIVGNTISFNISASAGDGRTGYCVGTLCV